ncbi:FG-GAP-like repeat-containing protein [Ideonella oryzae]|uniref:FG-GAP-like repeat-containing protein n=1 Tax=Ideonella oryzae TaxID=2937441 RepID=A0ABT1BIQ8_9BURK|nr:FG-GAP-like repeat-containing protein [Ideonella oryzae]MCO5975491.1 FG-GAP-like repeat-containing protein [Ideonella oryzae]
MPLNHRIPHRLTWLPLLLACGAAGAQTTGVIGKDASATVSTSPTQLVFKIKRANGDDTSTPVTVQYSTQAVSAVPGSMYRPASGLATIRPGKNQVLVPVDVLPQPAGSAVGGQLSLNLSRALAPSGTVNQLSLTSTATSPQMDSFIWGMAMADFNGDGKPDVVTASSSLSALQVALNTTSGPGSTPAFGTPTTLSTVSTPAKPVVCDLNNDGRPDVAAATQNTNRLTVQINTTATGAATASFQRTDLQSLPWGYMSQMACADLDGDGRLDLIGAGFGSGSSPGSNRAIVFRNTTVTGASTATFDGPVGFSAHPTSTNSRPETIVAADFNGDGRPDIALGNSNTHDVTILLNTTEPGGPIQFAPPVAFDVIESPTDMAVGDFNGDGRMDIVTANGVGDLGGVTWSLVMNLTKPGSNKPKFSATTRQVGGNPFGVAVADMDLDGRPDVLVSYLTTGLSVDGAVGVLLNRSPSEKIDAMSFIQANLAIKAAVDEPHALAAADLDGDGIPDILAADFIATGNGRNPMQAIRQTRATTPLAVLRSGTGDIAP